MSKNSVNKLFPFSCQALSSLFLWERADTIITFHPPTTHRKLFKCLRGDLYLNVILYSFDPLRASRRGICFNMIISFIPNYQALNLYAIISPFWQGNFFMSSSSIIFRFVDITFILFIHHSPTITGNKVTKRFKTGNFILQKDLKQATTYHQKI